MHLFLLLSLCPPALAGIDPASEQQVLPTTGSADPKFGLSQGSTGDINGDGFDDWLVASHGDDQNGIFAGAVYLYYGSPTGIDITTEQKIAPAWASFNDQYGAQTRGTSGDINGDGFNDVAVGGFGDDSVAGQQGGVVTYLGSASGLDVSTGVRILESAPEEWTGFGGDIGLASDVNGDGYDDMVVGKYYVAGFGDQTGEAWVFLGSPTGIDASSELKLLPFDNTGEFQRFGHHVASGGDIDNDGYDDIAIGSFFDDDNGALSGSVYVYYGSPTGIDPASVQKVVASNGAANDAFGDRPHIADLDGDGFAELIVGAPKRNTNQGAVYIYEGTATGLDLSSEQMLVGSDTDNNSLFGGAVSTGDMDGDGDLELAIGAPGHQLGGLSLAGVVYLYGWDGAAIDDRFEQRVQLASPEENGRFGLDADVSGDFNGDGLYDLVTGSTANNEFGAAYAFLSVPTPFSDIPFMGPLPLLLLGAGLAGAGTSLTRREDD